MSPRREKTRWEHFVEREIDVTELKRRTHIDTWNKTMTSVITRDKWKKQHMCSKETAKFCWLKREAVFTKVFCVTKEVCELNDKNPYKQLYTFNNIIFSTLHSVISTHNILQNKIALMLSQRLDIYGDNFTSGILCFKIALHKL